LPQLHFAAVAGVISGPASVSAPGPDTLAAVRFGSAAVAEGSVIVAPLPPSLSPAAVEIWRSSVPVRRGSKGAITFAENGAVLFGHLKAGETGPKDLARITFRAYRQILGLAREAGFPHLIRIWNVLARINEQEAGLERYRAFCRGRHLALRREMGASQAALPAASAIGSRDGPLLVYWLASRTPGVAVENPRQVSAFRYPRDYGPKSPSFSRAMALQGIADDGRAAVQLWISGTASIVGHETRHPFDSARQLEETLTNLDALIEAADARCGVSFSLASLRVYVRNPGDALAVETRLRRRFGTVIPISIVAGAICRQPLMLEIEGLAVA
jgi:chorismate lyase/3-hydroxybenzoate synthase